MTCWASYHLFYHGDRDRLLAELVRPAIGTLWRSGLIESFFFIRYNLGGPHVRIRVRPRKDGAESAHALLQHATVEFLERHPSREPLPPEAILRQNREILAGDPRESEDAVYPDNTLLPFPLRFETERYGGDELLPCSLDFFALSSLEALRFLAERGEEPPARRMGWIFRCLARQALGFARDREELLVLLEYGVGLWKRPLAGVAAHADEVYERRRENFLRLLRHEIEIVDPFTEASRRFSGEVRRTAAEVRRRIGISQMHMSANRLGLRNSDEVYVSRLLERAARDLVGRDWEPPAQGRKDEPLHALLPQSFSAFFGPPGSP